METAAAAPSLPGKAAHADAHGDQPLPVEDIPSQGMLIYTTPSYPCSVIFLHPWVIIYELPFPKPSRVWLVGGFYFCGGSSL